MYSLQKQYPRIVDKMYKDDFCQKKKKKNWNFSFRFKLDEQIYVCYEKIAWPFSNPMLGIILFEIKSNWNTRESCS